MRGTFERNDFLEQIDCEANRCRPKAKIAGAQEQIIVTDTSTMLGEVRKTIFWTYGVRC